MSQPLVSVVCLCYNHAAFVTEAMESVLNQSYQAIELIVVDDCSTDGSQDVIRKFIDSRPGIRFFALDKNLGNCRAFNTGFRETRGEFIIDLAADDVLMPQRIATGLRLFETHGDKMGVHFSDAEIIDRDGKKSGSHSDRFPHATIPQGDIYPDVLSRYFINSPTMMMRRAVLDKLGGYDEHLDYEDFDFWVRSSRDYHYYYTPEALIKRRYLPSSMGSQQNKLGSQLESTLVICRKALKLNRTAAEHKALKKRVRYEGIRAIRSGRFNLAMKYLSLWREIPG